jgi:hypothetical protein
MRRMGSPATAVVYFAHTLQDLREAGRARIPACESAEAWDVIEEIPSDAAAALVLLEHHWAVPLRDACARAGGFRITDDQPA